jgi:formiminotetrahydrofolate cyclodeaminase
MADSAVRYADVTLSGFSEALASAEPVPGGGSASAIAAALGASLVAMVARLSLDRPKYAAYGATHQRGIATGDQARVRFLELADLDAAAYQSFVTARRMPQETAEEKGARDEQMRATARQASEVPLEVVRLCHQVLLDVEALAGRSNLNASSDLDVAGLLLSAAAQGAGANVVINLSSVEDARYAGSMLSEVEGYLHQIESAVSRVHAQVRSGGLRGPE